MESRPIPGRETFPHRGQARPFSISASPAGRRAPLPAAAFRRRTASGPRPPGSPPLPGRHCRSCPPGDIQRLHIAHSLGRPGGHRVPVGVPDLQFHIPQVQHPVQHRGGLAVGDGILTGEGRAAFRGLSLNDALRYPGSGIAFRPGGKASSSQKPVW